MAELRTPQGHTLLLPSGGVGIGSDPSNEVQVAAHLGLAALHFRLQPWEGGHFIEDAGSGLGTLVNGHPVNWKPLAHGDTIHAGELEVVYVQHHEATHGIVPVAVVPPTPAVPGFPSLESSIPTPGRAPDPTMSATATSLDQLLPTLKPPAWLPEDLWPEALKTAPNPVETLPPPGSRPPAEAAWPVGVLTPPQPFSSFLSAAASAAASLPPSAQGAAAAPRLPPRRKVLKRVFAVAACLILLGGVGHFAWHQGHLDRWIPALQPADPPSPSVPSPPPPVTVPATGVATPRIREIPAETQPPVPTAQSRVVNQSTP